MTVMAPAVQDEEDEEEIKTPEESPKRPQVVKKHPKFYLCKEVQESLMRFQKECNNNSCQKCEYRRVMKRREQNALAAAEEDEEGGRKGTRVLATTSPGGGKIKEGSLWALSRALVEDKARREEALDQDENVRDQEFLKRVLRIGADSILAEYQIQQMTVAFRRLAFSPDREKLMVGRILPREFQNVLSAVGLNPLPTRRQMHRAFQTFDQDKDGYIDMKEWERIVRTRPLDYEIRKAFRAVDNDRSGFVDGEELQETFKLCFAIELTGEEILELAAGRPPDARKLTPDELAEQLLQVQLSYEEFRDVLTEGMFPEEGQPLLMQKVFSAFDADASGKITKQEMTSGMLRLGVELTDDQASQLFGEIDTDQSGEVDISEFCEAMTGIDKLGGAVLYDLKDRASITE